MTDIDKTRWFDIKVLLIPLLIILTSCGGGTNEKELMERARGYLEERDLNAAALELKNILRNNEKHAEARYLLGRISLVRGDMESALKELRRAGDAGWDEATINVLLAEVLFRQRHYQALLDDIPVKDSYPAAMRAELLGLWAAAELGLRRWDEAAQTVSAGEALNVDSHWVLQSRIRFKIHEKDLQTAAQLVEHALEVHPDSQDLWLLSARLASDKGDVTAADAALQKAIELDPPKMITIWGRQARLTLGQLWLQQQNLEKAQAAIDPVVKTFPGDPLANYLAAVIAFRQDRFDQTEERLLAALRVAPDHQPSLLLFGALNYARNDFEQAAHYLGKAAALQPENIGAQTLLGKTYLMLGQYDDAENRLKFASSKSADNAELMALVGLSRLRAGNTLAGIHELEKAAAASPADMIIRSELARAYMATGETERAIKELESALEGKDQQHPTEALLILAYLRGGEFDRALDLASKLSEQFPDNPLSYALAGAAYEGKKDLASARNRYDKALAIKPDYIIAILSLARLDIRADQINKARQRYQSVLKIQPNSAAAMVALAKLAAREDNVEEALELLEKARKANNKALEPRLILAKYYLKKGMAEDSLTYASEALELAPQNPLAILAVGRAQLGTGKPAAVQTMTQLTERLPDAPYAHYYLAEARARFDDISGSRQSLQKVLELEPKHERAMLVLGRLELSQGKTPEALKIAQKLQKAHPESASGYLLEGDSLGASNKAKDALSAYQKALSYAQDGEVVIKISRAHRVLGDAAASYDALQKWLKQYPEDQATRFVLAQAYLTDDNKDAAIDQYELIIEKQPEHAVSVNDLAWLYHERGKPGALEMAEKAYRLAPGNPAIQDTYGWILIQNGKVELGLIALEQAVSGLPNSPDIRYHLAVALAKAGDKAAAKQELSQALKTDKAFSERSSAEALQKKLDK